MDYYRQLCVAVILTVIGLRLSRGDVYAMEVVHALMLTCVGGIWGITVFLAVEKMIRYHDIRYFVLPVVPGVFMYAFDGLQDGKNGLYFQLGMIVGGSLCLSICTGRLEMLLQGILTRLQKLRLPPTPPPSPPRLICPQHTCGCRRPEPCSHHSCGCRHVESCLAHTCGCRAPEICPLHDCGCMVPEVCPAHACRCRPPEVCPHHTCGCLPDVCPDHRCRCRVPEVCPVHVCGCLPLDSCDDHNCDCRPIDPCDAHRCGCRPLPTDIGHPVAESTSLLPAAQSL